MKRQSEFTRTDEDMAAEVLLLVTLTSNIHAVVIQRAGGPRKFILDQAADFCSISRWTGEEKELLWNSSAPHDSSLGREVSYKVSSLKASDSGQYQEQCWTQGKLTHERNSTLLVCGDWKMTDQRSYPEVGQTVELTCDGAGPNRSVQWASSFRNHRTGNRELALIDNETSSVYKLQLVKNLKSSLLVTVDRPLGSIYYYCLERSRQRCDLLRQFTVHVPPEIILHSVGESLALNCSATSGNQTHVWTMLNSLPEDEVESHNYTLMIPSLTLSHTGDYNCEYSDVSREFYELLVCPESDPPAVVSFTVGENMTLKCGDWKQTDGVHWFMRSNRTEGRVSRVHEFQQRQNIHLSDLSLVISNVSLEDSGEFWCVILKDRRCAFRSKSLVMFREAELDLHLVRSVLVSVAVMVMCVAVVVVAVWISRSRQRLPGPVEQVEMSHLSPASADRQLETPSHGHDPVQ